MGLFKECLAYYAVIYSILANFQYVSSIYTYEAVPVNATGTVYVNPCFAGSAYQIEIFNESLTRAEADFICKQRGYDGLHTANAGWNRWFHIRDVLVDVGYHDNVTFWEGRFRPFFHIKDWFRETTSSYTTCKTYNENSITEDGNQFSQCAEIRWDSFSSEPTIFSRDCSGPLPYMCARFYGSSYFNTYAGYMINQTNISSIVSEFNDTIVTYDDCAQLCINDTICIAYTFNHSKSSSNCMITNLLYGYGPDIYEITPGHDNITLGMKTGCSVISGNVSTNFSLSGIDDTLPDCGLSPIPANYCRCESNEPQQANKTMNSSELDQIVNSLVSNLTVSDDTTSSTLRKYTSAKDDRPSAKFFGSVGIIIITVVFALPVVADYVTFGLNVKNRRKNKKKKSKYKMDAQTDHELHSTQEQNHMPPAE